MEPKIARNLNIYLYQCLLLVIVKTIKTQLRNCSKNILTRKKFTELLHKAVIIKNNLKLNLSDL